MSTKRKPNRFERKSEVRLPTRGLTTVSNPALAGVPTTELPLAQIEPDENQPRTSFNQESLDELSASIAARGVLQPIRVRPDGDTYTIISGERRYRAAKAAGLEFIPVVVEVREDYTDFDSAIDALVENLQREDLNVVDEVEGIFQLVRMRALTELGEDVAHQLTYSDIEQALTRMRNSKAEEFQGLEAAIVRTVSDLGLSWKTLAIKKASVWRWPADVLEALRSQAITLAVASVLKTIKDDGARQRWLAEAVEEQFSASTLRARLKTERLKQEPDIETRAPALRARFEMLLEKAAAMRGEGEALVVMEQFDRIEEAMSALERILQET